MKFPKLKDVEGNEIANGETCDWETLSSKRSAELELFYSQALGQSILKKSFEGTLLSAEEIASCKVVADYEPASVLLEKIKVEKKKL